MNEINRLQWQRTVLKIFFLANSNKAFSLEFLLRERYKKSCRGREKSPRFFLIFFNACLNYWTKFGLHWKRDEAFVQQWDLDRLHSNLHIFTINIPCVTSDLFAVNSSISPYRVGTWPPWRGSRRARPRRSRAPSPRPPWTRVRTGRGTTATGRAASRAIRTRRATDTRAWRQ